MARYLSEDRIDLDLDASFDEDRPATMESVTERMADLLVLSDDIVNASKLRSDLVLRERRAPSLPGGAVALPHVRTLQARRLVMAVGLSGAGLPIAEPAVRLVIALVAPPYDDRTYLNVYKRLGEALQRPGWLDDVLACTAPGEVIRLLAT